MLVPDHPLSLYSTPPPIDAGSAVRSDDTSLHLSLDHKLDAIRDEAIRPVVPDAYAELRWSSRQ